MKKHIFWIAIIAFFGLFMSYDASAQGRGYGHNKHHYKEQKRAYKDGYYQGVRHANRYDRRHHGYYSYNRPYRHYNRPYRYHRRHHAYYAPAPRPYVRGGVSIHIPLPPHP